MPFNTSFSPQYLASHARRTLPKDLKGSKAHWYALLMCSTLGYSQTRCTAIVPYQWDDSSSSSGSSSSSESPPSTPPSSPRLAKQKLLRRPKTSSELGPFRTFDLLDHIPPRERHHVNVSSTETGKRRRNRPYGARHQYEGEAERREREERDSGGMILAGDYYAFSRSVNDISTSMNAVHVDETSWWTSLNAESEMAQISTHWSLVDFECRCVPPTPLVSCFNSCLFSPLILTCFEDEHCASAIRAMSLHCYGNICQWLRGVSSFVC